MSGGRPKVPIDRLYPREPEDVNDSLDRLMVPNGWIILDQYNKASFYYHDPLRLWRLEPEEKE